MSKVLAKGPQAQDGGPSQYKQSTRKGKKAWRKNIDIQDVLQGMESLREEEQLTGGHLHQKKDSDLFLIDTTGDDKIRASLPRPPKPQLTSTKILSERSAVPAVFSRPAKRKILVTREDKDRLSRIAKKGKRGPFNSIIDPTEMGAGSAMIELTEAVKSSGGYDVWSAPATTTSTEEEGDGFVVQENPKVKAPKLQHLREVIEVPSVPTPHQGISYNPTVDAHQSLLLQAHTVEERRVKESEELETFKNKLMSAQRNADTQQQPGVPMGMTVQEVEEDALEEEEVIQVVSRPHPERKTKQQRLKAAKLIAEKRALAERLHRKRLLHSVDQAKALRKQISRARKAKEEIIAKKKLALREKAKKGLAGQRLGRHKVPEGEIDVQLGEDLSESLRALKPEGNLFRDRFLSMQHRALIEPRVRVLPKRRINKKVFETHASKRFV